MAMGTQWMSRITSSHWPGWACPQGGAANPEAGAVMWHGGSVGVPSQALWWVPRPGLLHLPVPSME